MKKTHEKRAWGIWTALFVFGLAALAIWKAAPREATGAEAGTQPPTQSAITIGTFDTRAVACAWGRSKAFLDWSAQLHKQGDEAKAAGDSKRIEELQKEGSGQQDRLHAQVFGNAPIDDILKRIEPDLPDLARKTGVDAISTNVTYSAPSVQIIDITDAIVALFDPTDETLKTIEALRISPPVELKIEH